MCVCVCVRVCGLLSNSKTSICVICSTCLYCVYTHMHTAGIYIHYVNYMTLVFDF